jgi:hypothetical protein
MSGSESRKAAKESSGAWQSLRAYLDGPLLERHRADASVSSAGAGSGEDYGPGAFAGVVDHSRRAR